MPREVEKLELNVAKIKPEIETDAAMGRSIKNPDPFAAVQEMAELQECEPKEDAIGDNDEIAELAYSMGTLLLEQIENSPNADPIGLQPQARTHEEEESRGGSNSEPYTALASNSNARHIDYKSLADHAELFILRRHLTRLAKGGLARLTK